MTNNGFKDGIQFPFPIDEEGKQYEREIKSRASAILSTLMGFRPSNYQSDIPSTNYAKHMRAMSRGLAKLTFRLERIKEDQSFETVRSEFLYQTVGNLVFINDKIPEMEFDDEEFRNFLLKVIEVYFQGSTPQSIKDAIELFTDEGFTIREKFKDSRKDKSTSDIGDQFEFVIEFDLDDQFTEDHFRLKRNINLLLELIKPAHTLFASRNIFGEMFDVSDIDTKTEWNLSNHYYEDVRSYWRGMSGFTSDQGEIKQSDKSVLFEKDDSNPLGSSAEGVELIVLEGENSGVYRVLESDRSENTVSVYPSFDVSEDSVSYRIRTDRKGANEEIEVTKEDATNQFRPDNPLEVDGNGPYTFSKGSSVTLSASSNYDEVEFKWDLTGNGVYDDAEGQTITKDIKEPQSGSKTVGVKGISKLYGKEYDSLEESERAFYEPSSSDIDKIEIYFV
jgi:hypothetical protein